MRVFADENAVFVFYERRGLILYADFFGAILAAFEWIVSRETIFCRIAVHTGAKHIKSLQKRDKRKIRVSKTSCKLWGNAFGGRTQTAVALRSCRRARGVKQHVFSPMGPDIPFYKSEE